MSETRRTLCNRDCPDTCGIVATVEDGRVTRIGGDPSHPVTRGFLCWRTNQYLSTQYSAERLTQPLLRKNGELVPVTWEAALDVAAERLTSIRAESGPSAIFHYRSGGSLGLLKALSDHFFDLFGPCTKKRGDICSGAGEAAQLLDFGVSDSSDLFGLLEAKNIILWGKNVVTSSPHTVPVLKDAQKRGARLVLVDPVHTRTEKLCERFFALRPGGDFALAMAVAGVLFERGWTDPDAPSYCDDVDGFREMVETKTVAEWCTEADLPVDAAIDLAERLGPGGPTTILIGWGMGRRTNGGATVRALDALAAITGNLGIPGGGASFYFRRRGAYDTSCLSSREPARTIPEPLFGQEVLAAKDPPIRAIWVTAGNPVVMLPDAEKVAEALDAAELVVVVDTHLTDTGRLADLVLPTETLLEADDLLGSYGHHYLGVARPVVPPPVGVKSDLEIVQALADRLGLGPDLAGDARTWKRRLLGKLESHGVTLEDLEAGPIKNPMASRVLFEGRRFPTPSGRVRLMTEAPASPSPGPEAYPLNLLSLSTPKSQSSQWAKTPPSEPVEVSVHPDSAGGVADGRIGVLESKIGRLRVTVRHDVDQRKDIALLPKGGHRTRAACANSIIGAKLTDIGEGGALYEERVRIEPERHVKPA